MRVGSGLLVIWNDVTPGSEGAFRRWHSGEHMGERMEVPGFRRGRRLFAPDAAPRWLTLYETDTPEVFGSAAYLARLDAPSAWTRETLTQFTGTARMAGRVTDTAGFGRSGRVLGLRAFSDPRRAGPAFRAMLEAACETGTALAGCVVVAETAAPQNTAERRLRRAEAETPTIAAILELAADTPHKDLSVPGIACLSDLYRLEHAVTARDMNGDRPGERVAASGR